MLDPRRSTGSLVLVLVLSLAAGGCQAFRSLMASVSGSRDIDTRPLLAKLADAMAPGEPRTAWRASLETADADLLHRLPDGRLLLGEWLPGFMPRLGPIRMLDARNGTTLWSHARDGDHTHDWCLLAARPVLVFEETNERGRMLHALDPVTGASIWQRQHEAAACFAVNEDAGRLFALELRPTSLRLAGIDLTRGRRLWTSELAGTALRYPPRLVAGGLLCAGAELCLVAADTGAPLWRFDLAAGGDVVLTASDSAVTVHDGHRSLTRLALATGVPHWSVDWPGRVCSMVEAEDRLFLLAELGSMADADGPSALLDCRLATSGGSLWQRRHSGRPHSALCVAGDRVGYASTADLRAFSVDGELIAAADLPGSPVINAYTERAPEELVRVGDRLWALGETGLVGIDLRTGEVAARLELIDVENSGKLAWSYTNDLARQQGKSGAAAAADAGAAAAIMTDHGRWMAVSADRSAEIARAQFGAGSSEYQLALSHSMAMLQGRIQAQQVQAGGQVLSAGWAAAAAAQKAMEQASVRARLVRVHQRIDVALQLHGASLQPPYYVRPFRISDPNIGRQGLLLVDLRDGRWCEITLQPVCESSTYFCIGTPRARVDAASGQVVVHGWGLDAAQWQSWDYPRGFTDATYPTASLLAFELGELDWRPMPDYVQRRKVLVGEDLLAKLEMARGTLVKNVSTRADAEALLGPSLPHGNPTVLKWIHAVETAGELQSVQLTCWIDDAGKLTYVSFSAWGPKAWRERWQS